MTPPPAAARPPAPGSLGHVARHLADARRVLVTGLVGAPAEAARAACDVAEALGAAIDFGQPDLARPTGPTIARAGEVTAAPEEMRDRADLVLLWGCDPAAAAPGIAATLPRQATVVRMPIDRATAVDAARVLQLLLRGDPPPGESGPLIEACMTARAAIEKASCVAVVTDDADDALGLEAWSVVHLVRAIAHVKPAFEIPLRAADHAAAAAVSTWRYGAAGAIARADRAGGRFLPAEAAARRLIERGEVECVLAIGRLTDDVEAALRSRGDAVRVVRVAADPQPLRELLDGVRALDGGDRR